MPRFFWLLVTLYARVAGTRCVLCVFSVFIASETKQSRFIISAGDARSAFYLLDCHATNVARNDRGDTSHTRTGHKSRTSIGNNSCTSTLSFETKRSRFIMSAGDARSAFLFTGLLRFARNDKRRCRVPLPCNDKDWV